MMTDHLATTPFSIGQGSSHRGTTRVKVADVNFQAMMGTVVRHYVVNEELITVIEMQKIKDFFGAAVRRLP